VLLREGLVAILVDKVVDFVKENGRVHSRISVCVEESKKNCSYVDNVEPASDRNKQHSPTLRCVDRDHVVFYGLCCDASVSSFVARVSKTV
jgi:hypothetical protein